MSNTLESSIIEQFQQVCDKHPNLDLDDFFEIDTRFFPDALYPSIYQLQDHFAQEENRLWTQHLTQIAEQKGYNNKTVFSLYFGNTQRRMSDAMLRHYFLVEDIIINNTPTISPLDSLRTLSENNENIHYHQFDGKTSYLSFPDKIITEKPSKEHHQPHHYLMSVDNHNFELSKVERPSFFSYPYYVARQLCDMLSITSLGDDIKEGLAAKGIHI